MRLGAALLLFGLTLTAYDAVADEAYVAGGLGNSRWDFDCGPNGCDRHTTAWRVAAGYRFNRIVALEAFYFDFGRARSSQASIDGELGGTAVGAQALVGWQFGKVDLAGKVGLASVRADFRAAPTSFNPSERARHSEVIAGAMAAYRVLPRLAVRFDIDVVTVALKSFDTVFFGNGANVTTLSLGVQYGF